MPFGLDIAVLDITRTQIEMQFPPLYYKHSDSRCLIVKKQEKAASI